MKKRWLCPLALIWAALLFSCAAPPQEEAGLKLWFGSDSDRERLSAAFGEWRYEGEETVPGLMDALLGGPAPESGLTRVIPVGTRLLDWTVEERVAWVELSAPYSGLVGVDLTLADYSIALTLTQLSGVDGVRIAVSGGGHMFQDRRVFRAGDVMFSGAEEEPVEVLADLYFLRDGTGELGVESRVFRLTEDETPVCAVMEALIAGPMQEGLSALLPEGVRLNSARVDDEVCTVDLSEGLRTVLEDPLRQELAVSSIVKTLCSLDQVEQVQILIDGEPGRGGNEASLPVPPA